MLSREGKIFMMKIWLLVSVFMLLSFGNPFAARHQRLKENIIKRLFDGKPNGFGSVYKILRIKWEEGNFTGKNAVEALVLFNDDNRPHVANGDVLWLLKYEGEWKPEMEVTLAPISSFRTVDIEKDGRLEICTTGGQCHQGNCGDWTTLISLNHGAVSVLYMNEGQDPTGGFWDGDKIVYKTDFWDIDGDGVQEILELKETQTFKGRGDKSNHSEFQYVQISSTSKTMIYKLIDGKFKETRFRAVE